MAYNTKAASKRTHTIALSKNAKQIAKENSKLRQKVESSSKNSMNEAYSDDSTEENFRGFSPVSVRINLY